MIAIPSIPDASFVSRPSDRPPWEIYVNTHGERFMREDHPSVDYREHALTRQSGQRMWVLADQEMIEKAEPMVRGWDKDKIMAASNDHPMFAKAENLDILAAKAGINPVGLAESVATYNRTIAEGTTDPFGRQHRPVQLSKPPFYTVRVTSTYLVSFAGLAIDSKLRVIRSDGTPVPNLYAAGEVIGAGATSGNSYCSGESGDAGDHLRASARATDAQLQRLTVMGSPYGAGSMLRGKRLLIKERAGRLHENDRTFADLEKSNTMTVEKPSHPPNLYGV